MKQIEGKIILISRFGGIKLGGQDKWFNPANDKGKENILNNKSMLLNKNVSLALDDKGKIIGYTLEQEEPKEKVEEEEEKQEPTEPVSEYSKRIVRQNALRHATAITTTIFNSLSEEKKKNITVEDLTRTTIEQAKTINKWILGDNHDD